jgi:serine/threonine protein phosphatase PrpC
MLRTSLPFRLLASFSTQFMRSTVVPRTVAVRPYPYHPSPTPLLFTVAAVLALRPKTTLADSPSSNAGEDKGCPFYGCPLYPVDVHYGSPSVQQALAALRETPRDKMGDSASGTVGNDALDAAGRDDAVTLTLIGYKGGGLSDQVNQDRSFVVSPFRVPVDDPPPPPHDQGVAHRVLVGVFDGHAPLGELVSEFTAQELPIRLARNLQQAERERTSHTDDAVRSATQQCLVQTFLELDRDAPAHESGGCTATVVLLQNDDIFVANAGDSRSMIVTYRARTRQTRVAYISREDKPSLPDERARVEAMGGQVYIPARGTSRVVYHDSVTGVPTGLAMSRSIGDWEAGKLGVIAEPIVDVLHVPDVVANARRKATKPPQANDNPQEAAAETADSDEDDVYVFCVSATDGMMDFLSEDDVARVVAHALYESDGPHPITACERLVYAAANAWQQSKQGRYRDDIAIAISTLRTPPPQKFGIHRAASKDEL